jgi:DNA-binding MarR family transcriptional regulator
VASTVGGIGADGPDGPHEADRGPRPNVGSGDASPEDTSPGDTSPAGIELEIDPTIDPEVVADIRRGATRFVQRMRVSRAPGALSTNKLVVLSHLRRLGPTTPGALAAAEHQLPQSLTRVFTDLAAAGLIERGPDPSDHRRSLIAITPAGQAALGRDMAARDRWLAAAMAGLSETERGLLHLAGRLMEALASMPPTAPAAEPAAEREPPVIQAPVTDRRP